MQLTLKCVLLIRRATSRHRRTLNSLQTSLVTSLWPPLVLLMSTVGVVSDSWQHWWSCTTALNYHLLFFPLPSHLVHPNWCCSNPLDLPLSLSLHGLLEYSCLVSQSIVGLLKSWLSHVDRTWSMLNKTILSLREINIDFLCSERTLKLDFSIN